MVGQLAKYISEMHKNYLQTIHHDTKIRQNFTRLVPRPTSDRNVPSHISVWCAVSNAVLTLYVCSIRLPYSG